MNLTTKNIRRTAAGLLAVSLLAAAASAAASDRIVAAAERIDRLHSLLVLHDGQSVVEHVRAGPGLDQPANIKSVSKTVLSALAGIAIEQGLIDGPDQPLYQLLGDRFPSANGNPALREITLGHALAMQTGLDSTSGRNYGRWVASPDWVAHVLSRPMVDRPGGRMIYSTGDTHLVSAALTAASGRSTHALAQEWLGRPLNVRIPPWLTDPQGIYFGGNEMHLSPRALARFGELYRLGGRMNGRQVISADWIERSWTANGRSPWTGDDYGFGWFITEIGGQVAYYGRGFGGQALFVVPAAQLTVVVTSDPNPPSPGGGQFRQIIGLVEGILTELAA
ncbi:MAG: serine hydrolase domain-containing protein [Wenzhouxiangella sp.]